MRIHYELANNDAVAATAIIVTIPGAIPWSDRDSITAKAGPTLLRNWGDGNEIVDFLAPLQLQSYTAQEKKIPPPKVGLTRARPGTALDIQNGTSRSACYQAEE